MASKGEKATLILSLTSVFFLSVALILNYFRTDIFGVIKGYAPHNFAFNLIYFLPLIFLSILTAFVTLAWILNNWKGRLNKKLKWISVSLILPTLVFFIVFIINIFLIWRRH